MTGKGLSHEDFLAFRSNPAELQAQVRLSKKRPVEPTGKIRCFRGGSIPANLYVDCPGSTERITVKILTVDHPDGLLVSCSFCGWRMPNVIAPLERDTVRALITLLFGSVDDGMIVAPSCDPGRGPDGKYIWQYWVLEEAGAE